jgi:hypothetical protein
MNPERILPYVIKLRTYLILRGGLGNQLHQIAAGVRLSEQRDGVLKVYSGVVNSSTNVTRRSSWEGLPLEQVFPSVRILEVNSFEKLMLRIVNQKFQRFFARLFVSERNFHTRSRLPVVLIKGYFQSLEYLPSVINFKNFIDKSTPRSDSINVHVRLTDFARIDSSPLGSSYYQNALSRLELMGVKEQINCWSDDVIEAQKLLSFNSSIHYPVRQEDMSAIELLSTLSKSNFLISSRSSLSWWASQIVTDYGGTVVSPFGDNAHNPRWLRA